MVVMMMKVIVMRVIIMIVKTKMLMIKIMVSPMITVLDNDTMMWTEMMGTTISTMSMTVAVR